MAPCHLQFLDEHFRQRGTWTGSAVSADPADDSKEARGGLGRPEEQQSNSAPPSPPPRPTEPPPPPPHLTLVAVFVLVFVVVSGVLQRIFAIASSACVAESYTSTRVQHAPRETCQPTDTLRSGPPPPLLLAPPRSPPHQRTPSNRDGHDRVEGGAYTHLRARPRTRVRLFGYRPPPPLLSRCSSSLRRCPSPPLPPSPPLLVLNFAGDVIPVRDARACAWLARLSRHLPTYDLCSVWFRESIRYWNSCLYGICYIIVI